MPSEQLSSETLDALEAMVSDPEKCKIIVEDDTLLGGLVVLLSNKHQEITVKALGILQKMSVSADNRPSMKGYMGLKDQLVSLKSNVNSSASLRNQAEALFATLWPSGSSNNSQQSVAPKDCTNQHRQINTKPCQKASRRNSMQVRGGLNKTGKTLVLQIRGMHDKEDMEVCRTMVLQVKGVVSITFDMSAKRAVLRARNEVKPETLAQAIARSCTMSAQLVTKDEHGNETFHKLNVPHNSPSNKENVNLPEYPDDDSPIKGSSNMARMGGDHQENDGNGWGFIKSVGNFFSNSFYW